MFFDNPDQIPEIAARTNCSIFAINPNVHKFKIKNSIVISPLENKVTISIDQIREVVNATRSKRRKDFFFIISPADVMTPEAANALLKTIEQPPEHYHFILLTKMPSALLPTVLSRSQVYFLRKPIDFTEPPKTTPQIKNLAKQLLAAKPQDLPSLAQTIAEYKPGPRQFALQIIEAAIEMLFKTFCQTHQGKWLDKIPKFITAYENISQNGHVKLHLVADLC